MEQGTFWKFPGGSVQSSQPHSPVSSLAQCLVSVGMGRQMGDVLDRDVLRLGTSNHSLHEGRAPSPATVSASSP